MFLSYSEAVMHKNSDGTFTIKPIDTSKPATLAGKVDKIYGGSIRNSIVYSGTKLRKILANLS